MKLESGEEIREFALTLAMSLEEHFHVQKWYSGVGRSPGSYDYVELDEIVEFIETEIGNMISTS